MYRGARFVRVVYIVVICVCRVGDVGIHEIVLNTLLIELLWK